MIDERWTCSVIPLDISSIISQQLRSDTFIFSYTLPFLSLEIWISSFLSPNGVACKQQWTGISESLLAVGGILRRRSHSFAEAILKTVASLEIPMRILISSLRSVALSPCLPPTIYPMVRFRFTFPFLETSNFKKYNLQIKTENDVSFELSSSPRFDLYYSDLKRQPCLFFFF